MSRLDYAPKLKEIQVTDFQKGLGSFAPKPDKPVSFAALRSTLKNAGYTLASADITVSGTLEKGEKGWVLVVAQSKQRFTLTGAVEETVAGKNVGDILELTADWKTIGTGKAGIEVITLSKPPSGPGNAGLFVKARFSLNNSSDAAESAGITPVPSAAPIRVTSPGLTVYKGGAVVPRVYLIQQHLENLTVNRQMLDLSLSYTPSPRVQLEFEVPISRTEYDDGTRSNSGVGIGNVTAWAKYRFFRKVKTYGDRQASARVGFELPTGKKTAPGPSQVSVPEFVRQQLTPINGGLSPHFDLSFSQAGGRLIFGGNAEVIFRSERDGFRLGHEQRISTDLEYVIPKDPHKPGGELFLILETTFVHRDKGRLRGITVGPGNATEYYLAPGLQYAAHPRLVIEGSYQFPVVLNTGSLALRTDRNLLLGIRYLF